MYTLLIFALFFLFGLRSLAFFINAVYITGHDLTMHLQKWARVNFRAIKEETC